MRRASVALALACRTRNAAVAPALPQTLLRQCAQTHAAASAGASGAPWLAQCGSLLPAIARSALRGAPPAPAAATIAAALATARAARSRYAAAVVSAGCGAAVVATLIAPRVALCEAASLRTPTAALVTAAAANDAAGKRSDAAAARENGMAELYALAGEHWAPMLVVAMLTLASTVLKLLCTRRMGALYELASKLPAGVPSALQLRPLAAVLGLRLAEGCARALQAWTWARAAARIETALAARAFAALLSTDTAALDCAHSSLLASHAAQDAAEATRALETLAFKGVRNVTAVLAGGVALAAVSPDISLMALSMVPPATLLFLAVGAWGARLAKAAAARAQAASAFACERLGAFRTVRSFAQEQAQCARYETSLARVRAARDAHAAAHAAHVGLLTALPGIGMGCWLYAGAELVARGALSVGALTTVIPLVMEIAGALGGLSRLHASLVAGADAARRLCALSAAPRAIEGAHAGAPLRDVRGAVAFHNVRFAYPLRPDVLVLDGFALQLAPGETFALVGESGSGKSTVAALLTRLYDVQGGSVQLDGADVRSLDPRALRRAIGHVTQEPLLFSGSIADNIAFAQPGAPLEAVVEAAKAANAHAFVSALPRGYDTDVGERGAQLSGGQRQRIAIARVLLAQPRLLLLVRRPHACCGRPALLCLQLRADSLTRRTRRRPRWTARASGWCPPRCSAPARAAPASSSRTACPRCAARTASASWPRAGWWRWARTSSCWRPAARTGASCRARSSWTTTKTRASGELPPRPASLLRPDHRVVAFSVYFRRRAWQSRASRGRPGRRCAPSRPCSAPPCPGCQRASLRRSTSAARAPR
jgi:ABC-type multidrug transport system fused ATPase/permease subunit